MDIPEDELEDFLDWGCPCPHHSALTSDLYATPLDMMIYLVQYQDAGDCCREDKGCRIVGCNGDEYGDHEAMRVPFCYEHMMESIITKSELKSFIFTTLSTEIKETIHDFNDILIYMRGDNSDDDDEDMEEEEEEYDEESSDNGEVVYYY